MLRTRVISLHIAAAITRQSIICNALQLTPATHSETQLRMRKPLPLGFSSYLELFQLLGLVKEDRRKSLLNNPLHISSQPGLHMMLLIQ